MSGTHWTGIFVSLAFVALLATMAVEAAEWVMQDATPLDEVHLPVAMVVDGFVALLLVAAVFGFVEFFRYYAKNPGAK